MKPTVGIALTGLGLVGKQHLKAIRSCPDISLAAIIDPRMEVQTVAKEEGVPYFSDLHQMYANTRPQGVLLATPNHLHVEMGLQCIEAGSAILVEKPISTTAGDAEKLILAAKQKSLPILVGHHRRYNPLIRQAKRVIEEGQIGDVRAVHATCWLYKPDAYFNEAPWRTKKGAGPISVNIIHDVDLLRYLCGEIVSVHAVAMPAKRGFENEDVASALLTFASGAIGTLSVSDSIVSPWSWELTAGENPAYHQTDQSAYMIGGSDGSLSIPDLRVWRNGEKKGWWEPISAISQSFETSEPLVKQLTHFAEVIRGTAQPLVSGEEGKRTLRVVEAIQKSSETNETIKL